MVKIEFKYPTGAKTVSMAEVPRFGESVSIGTKVYKVNKVTYVIGTNDLTKVMVVLIV